jgi:hypothetical protein
MVGNQEFGGAERVVGPHRGPVAVRFCPRHFSVSQISCCPPSMSNVAPVTAVFVMR